jgi:hypothetical protein
MRSNADEIVTHNRIEHRVGRGKDWVKWPKQDEVSVISSRPLPRVVVVGIIYAVWRLYLLCASQVVARAAATSLGLSVFHRDQPRVAVVTAICPGQTWPSMGAPVAH